MADLPVATDPQELLVDPPASLEVEAGIDGVQGMLRASAFSGLRLVWVDQLPWLLPALGLAAALAWGACMGALALVGALTLATATTSGLLLAIAGMFALARALGTNTLPFAVDNHRVRIGRWSRALREIKHLSTGRTFAGSPVLFLVTRDGQVRVWTTSEADVPLAHLQWLAQMVELQARRAGTPVEPVPEALRQMVERHGNKG